MHIISSFSVNLYINVMGREIAVCEKFQESDYQGINLGQAETSRTSQAAKSTL